MQLTRFSVERYRSLTAISEFNLSDLTVLVGPNNEGKSNVLRALDCALNILKFLARRASWGTLRQRTLIYHNIFTPISGYYKWKKDYPIQYQKSGKKDNCSIFVMTFSLDHEESLYIIDKTLVCYPFKEIPIKLQINDDLIRISILIPELSQHAGNKKIISFILRYVAQKINICYIDAERTAETAKQTIEKLVDLRLQKVQSDPTFLDLIKNMRLAFDQEMQEMSKQINVSLKSFISGIKKTDVFFLEKNETPFISLYDRFNINVDDGITTLLSQKGSGVQSLVALFLANYVSKTIGHSDSFILAVDEPESHLHPDAIHNIENILKSISENNQVIISTHSPILVQTSNPHRNIIVKNHIAKEAARIDEIRTVLGIQPADNLTNAKLVLVVEGTADENLLPHLISFASTRLKTVIDNKALFVSSCGGTANMESYIRYLRSCLCEYYVLVDDDEPGRKTIERLQNEKLIENNYTILVMKDKKNSEIEDMLNPENYANAVASMYGIHPDCIKAISQKKTKWSTGILSIIRRTGKRISDADTIKLKTIVSEEVKKYDRDLLLAHRTDAFNNMLSSIETFFTQ